MAKIISEGTAKAGTNLLLDNEEMPAELVVHVAKEIPKMREIIFINNKDPKEMLEFHYHSKTHPLKHYKLLPGQRYTLSEEVINHLEGQSANDPYSCHKREYAERMVGGMTELYVTNYVSYYQCRPVR